MLIIQKSYALEEVIIEKKGGYKSSFFICRLKIQYHFSISGLLNLFQCITTAA